jgi:hypothetical protein
VRSRDVSQAHIGSDADQFPVVRSVPDPDLDSTALALEFSEGPTETFAAAKRPLTAGERKALRRHLEEEAGPIAAWPTANRRMATRPHPEVPLRTGRDAAVSCP